MVKRVAPFVFLLASLAAACTPTTDLRGHKLPPELLAQVKVGLSTQDEVQAILGSPSSTMTYGTQTWHYVFERTETTSFLTPEIKEYTTVTIVFDDAGRVKQIDKSGLNDLTDVTMVSRETPTAGKEMSFMEQMLGNVGKLPTAGALGGNGGGGGPSGGNLPGGR